MPLCVAQDWTVSDDFVYPDNEELHYNVYYKTGPLWFSLGEVKFVTSSKEGQLELRVSAHTFPRWRRFHEFHSEFVSILDVSGHLPETYVRRSVEKGKEVFDSIAFDQKNLKAKEWVSNDGGEMFNYELDLSQPAYDMISLYYRFRSMDFDHTKEDKEQKLRLLYNRREYDILIRYKGKENKKIKKGGKHGSHLLKINAINGLHFKGDQVMSMWISDEDTKIPLTFETPLKFGSLRIVLKEAYIP